MKEVSSYYGLGDVMEVIIGESDIHSKSIYFKTIGMPKWEEITDYEIALGELSMEIIIFLVVVDAKEKKSFEKAFLRNAPQSIMEINVGDEIKFEHPTRKMELNMIFMGKNVEGKYILHIPGEPYIYDICVLENELLKKGKLLQNNEKGPIEEIKAKKKEELGLVGIPNLKGLGYINSCILHLYYNWGFKQQLSLMKLDEQFSEEEEKPFIKVLAKIFKDITYKKKVETKFIQEAIDLDLPDFSHFSADMCQ